MENYKQIDSISTLKQFSSSKSIWHDRIINQNAEVLADENKPSRFLDKFCRIQDFRDLSEGKAEKSKENPSDFHQVLSSEKRLNHMGSTALSPVHATNQTQRGAQEINDMSEPFKKQTYGNVNKMKGLKITLRGGQKEGLSNIGSHTPHNHINGEFYYHLKLDHDGKNLAHERKESPNQAMRSLHPYFHSEKVLKNFYVSSEINLVRFFEKMNYAKNSQTPITFADSLATKDTTSKSTTR